ncbi:hypothetical protein BDC45DRAFT_434854 [Circinella umbellata]|nr:hypothetical protein BDC45DRAFT_434854 [Circinella umbellata]
MSIAGTRCFLRMGDDPTENAKTVLDFVIMQLQQKTAHSNRIFQSFGAGTMYTTRPWALVFVHDSQSLSNAINNDISRLENRQWLESIQVCQVENIHQIRAILCALHIQQQSTNNSSQSDILSWIQNERDNQPPCLIVVKGLLQWMKDLNRDTL